MDASTPNSSSTDSSKKNEDKANVNMSAESGDDAQNQPEKEQQSPNEGEQDVNGAASGWWSVGSLSGFIQTAKQKSTEAYEFMRKDLAELKDVVANDTAAAVTSTASYFKGTLNTISSVVNESDVVSGDEKSKSSPQNEGEDSENAQDSNQQEKKDGPSDDVIEIEVPGLGELAEKAKSGLSSLVNALAYAFSPTFDTTVDDAEDDMLAFSETVSRWKVLLSAVQNDPQTYCNEPEGPREDYEAWLMTFNLFEHEPQIEHLLSTVPKIREYHQSLVPSSLNNAQFWQRYFYKVHQLKELEIKRAKQKKALEKQQNQSSSSSSNVVEKAPTSSKQSSVETKMLNESLSSSSVVEGYRQSQPQSQVHQSKGRNQKSGASSPASSEAKASTTSTDDWEKTDIGDLLDEARISKKFDEEKKQQSKDDINDWEFE